MKFFRMDSDLPNWDEWGEIADELRPSDYHACFTLYMVLYSKLADRYKYKDQKTFRVSINQLARSARISVKKCEYFTTILRQKYNFSCTRVGNFYEIEYPNFLRKQRMPSRDGDGKFTDDVDR
jgi:hypothetical protein